MGSKTTTTKNTSATESSQGSGSVRPTDEQGAMLGQVWDAASGAFTGAQNNQYGGQQQAQFNPNQLNTFQNMVGYGNSSTLPQQSAATGAALTGAGLGGTQSALNTLTGYTPQGGVGSNIDAAGQYSNNPHMSGMVDAAMRDANRSVSEQMLPQVARQSAMGGNALASKRAQTEALLQRGLEDRTADVSAQLRGDAWKQGLSIAEQARQYDNSSVLSAAEAAGGIGNNASKLGVLASDNSLAQQKSLYDIANAGGAGQQAATQADYDNQRLMMEYANKGDWDNAAKLYAIVGDKMWGNQSTTNSTGQKTGYETGTSKTDPGAAAIIGGGLGAVGSVMGMPTGGSSLFGKLFG